MKSRSNAETCLFMPSCVSVPCPCQLGEQCPRFCRSPWVPTSTSPCKPVSLVISWQTVPGSTAGGGDLGCAGTCHGAAVGGSRKGEKTPSRVLIPSFLCYKQSKCASRDHSWIVQMSMKLQFWRLAPSLLPDGHLVGQRESRGKGRRHRGSLARPRSWNGPRTVLYYF